MKTKSQQQSFNFLNSIPKYCSLPKEETMEYKELEERSVEFLKKIISELSGYKNIVKILHDYGFVFKEANGVIIVKVGNSKFTVEDFSHPVLKIV